MHDEHVFLAHIRAAVISHREACAQLEAALALFGDDADPVEADVDWQAFVAEHPELSARAPLEIPEDDALVAAVAHVVHEHEAWISKRRPLSADSWDHSASAGMVACLLAGRSIDRPLKVPSPDRSRVGKRLARLAREGRIRLVTRPWETPPMYSPVPDA